MSESSNIIPHRAPNVNPSILGIVPLESGQRIVARWLPGPPPSVCLSVRGAPGAPEVDVLRLALGDVEDVAQLLGFVAREARTWMAGGRDPMAIRPRRKGAKS